MLKKTLGMYFVTWCLGGCLNAVYYQSRAGMYIRKLLYGGGEEVTAFWLFTAVTITAVCFCGASFWYRHHSERLYCQVILHMGENSVRLTALCDTGNSLYTMTGKPVSVMDQSMLEQLSAEKAAAIKDWLEGKTPDIAQGITLVPFESIGNPHEMMAVIYADTMIIKKDTAEETITKAAIGISPTHFSNGRGYQLILHKSLAMF